MELTKVRTSSHWYDHDGNPTHTVIGKNGNERDTTVRDARQYGLIPSVSTVLAILAKPGLDAWKQEQAIYSALTLPRIDGESELEYAKRIVQDAQEQSKKAMELGTAIHDAIESYCNGECEVVVNELTQYILGVVDWIKENVDMSEPMKSELRLVSPIGFAGTADLLCKLKDGRMALLDFKTQNTKEKDDHKLKFYDEWLWQLSAYGIATKPDVLINIAISTSMPGKIDIKEWTEEQRLKGEKIFIKALSLFKEIKEL